MKKHLPFLILLLNCGSPTGPTGPAGDAAIGGTANVGIATTTITSSDEANPTEIKQWTITPPGTGTMEIIFTGLCTVNTAVNTEQYKTMYVTLGIPGRVLGGARLNLPSGSAGATADANFSMSAAFLTTLGTDLVVDVKAYISQGAASTSTCEGDMTAIFSDKTLAAH